MGATAVGFFGSLGDQAQQALKRHQDAIDQKNADWRKALWGIYNSEGASPESRQKALDDLSKYYPKEVRVLAEVRGNDHFELVVVSTKNDLPLFWKVYTSHSRPLTGCRKLL